MNTLQFREQVLSSFGANSNIIQELLDYNKNVFDFSKLDQQLPDALPDEPFSAAWQTYKREAEGLSSGGLFEVLKQKLVQLQFPIQEGMSQSDGYRSATLRGASPDLIQEATGIQLEQPEFLELHLYKTYAGTIPVLTIRNRNDFVRFVQALTRKNEPADIPQSMGACMISGYNNWDRIREYRRRWEKQQGFPPSEESWQEEFKRIIPRKELYQDRFILLNDGPYSAVSHDEVGVTEARWRELSLMIRREHECTHYLTRRLFSSMQNHMLDELIADYAGIVAANGHYRSDWFLKFIGLEAFPSYRQGARLENYRGNPPLSEAAFTVLQSLLVAAANNLQRIDQRLGEQVNPIQMVIALCSLTLEELASQQAEERVILAIEERFTKKTDKED